MEDLVAWNTITDADAIRAGQKLVVASQAAPAKGRGLVELHRAAWRHALRIAQRQGCSVDDLRSWNGLKRNAIYAGQKLKVKKA